MLWESFFTEAIDNKARFSNSRRQTRKVTITRHDTEAIEFLCVEQIHCIND